MTFDRLPLAILFLSILAAPARAQERAVAPLEVRPSPAFQAAVEAGTRTETGEPGPIYWQQRADYAIEATVDPRARKLTGSETITYTNNSPDTLKVLGFHLYQNLFAEDAIRGRQVPITGGLELSSLFVDGQTLEVDPADNRQTLQQGTVMAVRLPRPLAPGGASATIEASWSFTIPEGEGVPRMGMVDSTTGQIAQWYPQIATYDDLRGWDTRPYLSNAEFYLEYGTFDLAITVPAGTVVAATGMLQNPEEVLAPAILERVSAVAGDEVVHVVTEADFGPGRATRGAPGETLTWRFHAEDVRDAAFAFSDHYLVDMTTGLVDAATGRRTFVHSFYRPGAASWRESARMTKDAIEVFSRNVHPYAYPQITSTEGLVGGMEYPMIVFVRDFGSDQQTDRVIAHELGHMWFPMMVGSDETAYAWMDEGVNTFITIFAAEHYYPESTERSEVRDAYERYTAANAIQGISLMSSPDAIAAAGGNVGVLGYRHPASALLALRSVLGDEVYDRALSEYTRRWMYRHPTPWDFFHTFESVASRDLDWFWAPWFYGPGISDMGISDVEVHATGGENHVVTVVRNDGTVLSPVVLRITTADGATTVVEAPATRWFDGRREISVEGTVAGDVAKVELDPERLYADVDSSDDIWTP
ncbi:MAG TPA: M1 family metallopeptidase [Gemmatimonadota bacterium]|nr:M1 family metallopeptidase [Gemmatimonadota bacterium]